MWRSSTDRGVEQSVLEVLQANLSPIMAKCVLRFAQSTIKTDLDSLSADEAQAFIKELERGVRLYAPEAAPRCARQLRTALGKAPSSAPAPPAEAKRNISDTQVDLPTYATTIPIVTEADIVAARHAGREVCVKLGFSRAEEVKAATVISELARNIVLYAKRGEVLLCPWSDGTRMGIEIRARDSGPGIPHLDEVLSGRYRSKTGLGLGIVGAKRLAHDFQITSVPGKGTDITVRMIAR